MTDDKNKSQKNNKPYLGDILGESKEDNPKINRQEEKKESSSQDPDVIEENEMVDDEIFKAYILHRVVIETLNHCKRADPKEAIGILLGYKYQFKGQKYVKVVDWVTGKANQSHAYAEFTPEGV
ncbi:MAG TPA: hypothetical protein VMZ29_16195, partial [Candidatus Bathyarchaeia archaeon]|nr:hypothetical protein [Candidatus Bathyarchaeia archaeon]